MTKKKEDEVDEKKEDEKDEKKEDEVDEKDEKDYDPEDCDPETVGDNLPLKPTASEEESCDISEDNDSSEVKTSLAATIQMSTEKKQSVTITTTTTTSSEKPLKDSKDSKGTSENAPLRASSKKEKI